MPYADERSEGKEGMILNMKKSENITLNEKEIKEIDFLKKIDKHIFVLKLVIIILIIFISLVTSIIIVRNLYKYKKGEQAYNIISTTYENTQKFINQRNFLFSETNETMKSTYYYKDKKFKEEFEYLDGSLGCNYKYGKLLNNTMISINLWDYAKIVNGKVTEDVKMEDKNYKFAQVFYYLNNLYQRDIIACSDIVVTEDIYDNVPCYILEENNKNMQHTIVIEKENLLVKKYAKRNIDGTYSWTDYNYISGNVLDDDLKLKDISGYEILDIPEHYIDEF